MSAPAFHLSRLARRYRLERAISRVLAGCAGGAGLAGLLHYAGAGTRGGVIGLLTGLAGGVLAAWIGELRLPVDDSAVARHLDRMLPELEESATLLVSASEPRGYLAALQRARVERRFDPGRADAVMPRREPRRAALVGVPAALLGGLLLLLPPSPKGMRKVWATEEEGLSLTLRSLEVAITPPKYTGVPARHSADSDIEVEEGAQLTWLITTAGPVDGAWLIPSSGDSIPLENRGEGSWAGTSKAERSVLVRVRLEHGGTLRLTSDDYRLAVRPDRPPTLTIVRPEERSSFDPGALRPVAVEVLANDDYGVDSASISATIASGRGEAVRFRRLRLPFSQRKPREGHGELLRATLDLGNLQLGPGDELYFDVEATDRKAPAPNRTRSETVFISVRDSSQAPTADLARLAIGAQPEYFRSQRQLIIDTEKLLEDRRRISSAMFRERSNELGMDQGLLRLRYGQFLGEEFEEEMQPMGGREHAANTDPDRQPAPAAGDQAPAKPNDPNAKAEAGKKATEELSHRHDDAENATLLGRSVKDKLREAVGAMWQAEGKLRITDPKSALPFMYRALELIKEVQQDARVYVQRVGFEPPPLEIAKLRLSGKLKGIDDRQLSHKTAREDTLPGVREALALLLGPEPSPPGLAEVLASAGQELAGLAVDDPRMLPVLRDLRQLTDSVSKGVTCDLCRERSIRSLWGALPPAEPKSEPGSPDDSPVARRFAALLRGGRP